MPAHEVGWPASRSWDQPSEPIVIGLVNNMPDAALPGTERQFRRLLPTACCETTVSVRLFAIPELHSPGTGVRQAYEDIGELWSSRLDGLIVTGREPRASALPDEPFWSTLTKLADWAQINTVSAIWSCLSAQAVVLHHHRIRRRPLGRKLYGVFDCHKTADHELTSTSPTSWRVAHSRLNEIPERDLVSNGYQILSRSPQAGADIFVRQSG